MNSLVLVEIVYDFFRLLRGNLDAHGTWDCQVSAWTFEHAGAELHRSYRKGDDWGYPPHPMVASGNDYQQKFSASGPAEQDAFECLFRIYGLWGLGKDAIPFTKDGQVNPAEIQALRS